MKLSQYVSISAVLVTAASTTAFAQQKAPAVRPLGSVTATSTDSIMLVTSIRSMPGGKLLVNDVGSRRVLMLDAALKLVSVVADTTAATANGYGANPGNLLPYRADSSLFIDAASMSMLVIDGKGNVVSVKSVPTSKDVGMLATSALGGTGFDGERMVYRGMGGLRMQMSGPANPGSANSGFSAAPSIPDTMPVVRVNLASRATDTAAYIKVSAPKMSMNRSEDGKMSVSVEIDPLPVVDEYAVLADGRLAIVRGRDYHVEFIDAAGKVTSGPKIPFEWKRLTDDEKAAFIDSVKAATERQAAAGGNSAAARVGSALGASMGAGAGPQMVVSTQTRSSASGEPPQRGTQSFQMAAPQVTYVDPSKLPDYQPAFFGNAARGDMDGNLWVRIISPKPIAGGPVYDVINGSGELIDRVQIPVGRSIIGFGQGGVVYLSSMEGMRTKIERASLK